MSSIEEHYVESTAIMWNLSGGQTVRPQTAEFMARGMAASTCYVRQDGRDVAMPGPYGTGQALLNLWALWRAAERNSPEEFKLAIDDLRRTLDTLERTYVRPQKPHDPEA